MYLPVDRVRYGSQVLQYIQSTDHAGRIISGAADERSMENTRKKEKKKKEEEKRRRKKK